MSFSLIRPKVANLRVEHPQWSRLKTLRECIVPSTSQQTRTVRHSSSLVADASLRNSTFGLAFLCRTRRNGGGLEQQRRTRCSGNTCSHTFSSQQQSALMIDWTNFAIGRKQVSDDDDDGEEDPTISSARLRVGRRQVDDDDELDPTISHFFTIKTAREAVTAIAEGQRHDDDADVEDPAISQFFNITTAVSEPSEGKEGKVIDRPRLQEQDEEGKDPKSTVPQSSSFQN